MPNSRKFISEDLYSKTASTNERMPVDPEVDVNVKRGLAWVIGGTITGAVVALAWFLYRMLAPVEPGAELAGGATDLIVMPILAFLYALLGAASGGFLGLCVGMIFVGIAAFQSSGEDEEEEEEEESSHPFIRSGLRANRGHS